MGTDEPQNGEISGEHVSPHQVVSKIKALLKKAAARTVEDLWTATASAIDAVTPAEARDYFATAGYEPK